MPQISVSALESRCSFVNACKKTFPLLHASASSLKSVAGSFHRVDPSVGSRGILMGVGDPPLAEPQHPIIYKPKGTLRSFRLGDRLTYMFNNNM
ncbi:MAG: hypothetical protein F6K14_17810 [Symploca sp. SIO2C1]|nr:hypothetical protein [Symploca sp. SIO2C1]